jgi:hypothetical protein
MIDKTSHYEYLATYVNDILVWSKDTMGVIKTLEKVYLLKYVGIPEHYIGGNVETLGDAWKHERVKEKDLLFLPRHTSKTSYPNLRVLV